MVKLILKTKMRNISISNSNNSKARKTKKSLNYLTQENYYRMKIKKTFMSVKVLTSKSSKWQEAINLWLYFAVLNS